MSDCHDCAGGGVSVLPPLTANRERVVAIVGPPNSGKSTLFNRLTGLRQKVANFPGVTVEHRMGKAKLNSEREVSLIDLPGIYSMEPRTEDERVTHDVLTGEMRDLPRPDAVLLILDSTNLGRHLVLAAPILSLGLPTMVVLNMADDLTRRGGTANVQELAEQIGCPVALTSAARGEGLEKVTQFLTGATAAPSKPALMQLPVIQDVPKCRAWAAQVGNRSNYNAPQPPAWTRKLDRIFLHPIAGPAIFAVVVAAVFQTIFTWAKPLMDLFQNGIESAGTWVGGMISNAALHSLVVDGIFKGVGNVIVFLPQIWLLFLFIGILEDSGYLARAALIADRTMARFGLQGKSFIPLLSAYACAIPAIMATRTIENKRDRMATILIAPFMTCSARLPVYTLVIAAFIPPDKQVLGRFFGLRAAVLLSLYIIGFLAAVITAKLLKSTILKTDRTSFMLEMPPYRWPTLRSLGLRLIDRSKVFLRRAGTVILGVLLLLWVLEHLPTHNGQAPELAQSFAGAVGHAIEPVIKPLGFNWKIGIGLVSSFAAREVIVGTLGTIYATDGSEESLGLQAALRQDLTLGGAVALLLFFAFAMQCMSTLAVVRRETGGWKWPAIQFAYMTVFAYTAAFIANKVVTAWF